MSADIEVYLNRIIAEHRDKPKFIASLSAAIQPIADLETLLSTIPSAFDLDLAVGVQLDAVGLWVGVPRYIPEPVANIFFSFDTVGLGFDQGYWKGPYDDGSVLAYLDDVTYRRLIRAKILANTCDGSIIGIQAVLDAFFVDPETHVFVTDNARAYSLGQSTLPADMSFSIGVSGKIPSIVDVEVFAQNLLPVKPAGVTQAVLITSVDQTPLFGFDVNNQFISGFDSGSWGQSPQALADSLA